MSLKKFSFYLIIGSFFILPLSAKASTFDYSAWIAYWKKEPGISEAITHMGDFKELHPFAYSVSSTGSLIDTAQIDKGTWTSLISSAQANGVQIIPTIMWSDTHTIYSVLASRAKRTAHVNAIVGMVTSHSFAGVDIDYENKSLATGPYFSAFLASLSAALHKANKTLSCTIEPRTPLNHLYAVIPKNQTYGNDYKVIGKVCDEVKVMAYDQDNADIVFNKAKGKSGYYIPIADPAWVEQVIRETLKTIPAKKVVLGVPTYSREFSVSTSTLGYQYKVVHSLSYRDAMSLAQRIGVIPIRNNADELGYSFATSTGTHVVSITDAVSIADKIALAKKYNLKGVAVFKVDGDEDQSLWNVIK